MANKIYVDVDLNNIEVWFYISDGAEGHCSYCDKPGYQQRVEIDMIFSGAHLVHRNSRMWRLAKEKAEQRLFHCNRVVCPDVGKKVSPCRKLYRMEIKEEV